MRLYDEYFCTYNTNVYKYILNRMGVTFTTEKEKERKKYAC